MIIGRRYAAFFTHKINIACYNVLMIIMFAHSQHEQNNMADIIEHEDGNEPTGKAKGGKARAAIRRQLVLPTGANYSGRIL